MLSMYAGEKYINLREFKKKQTNKQKKQKSEALKPEVTEMAEVQGKQ